MRTELARVRAVSGLLIAMIAASAGTISASDFGEQADYVAAVEQAKGHLLASRLVYRRGQRVRADVHASHPIQELGYRLWRPVTKVDRELGARLQAALKEPGRAVEARVPAGEYDKLVDQTLTLLDRAVARTVAADRRADPRFQARVLQALLIAIDEEYAEAVAEGRVVLEIEYQDAWGFFQRLREQWSILRKGLPRSQPNVGAAVEEQMAALAGAFSGIETPEKPVAVERVAAALNAIAGALAPLAAPAQRGR
jgi:hypothetical protein